MESRMSHIDYANRMERQLDQAEDALRDTQVTESRIIQALYDEIERLWQENEDLRTQNRHLLSLYRKVAGGTR